MQEKKEGIENMTFYGDVSDTTQGEPSGESGDQTKENIYQHI